MENNPKKTAQLGILVGIIIQIGLTIQNIAIFGWCTLIVGCYLIWGFIKIRQNEHYWLKVQRGMTIIVILEILVGFPLIYLFKNII